MLKRLICLILVYSLLILSLAGPALATSISSRKGDRGPSEKNSKEACPSCAAKPQSNKLQDAIDGLAVLGRTTQIQALVPIQRSVSEGVPVSFVSTATGHLGFTVNDLGLTGTMPLVFQRFYTSARREDRGLGEGWSFAFDDRITIEGDEGSLTGGDGSVIAFRAEGRTGHFVLKTPEPLLHQSFEVNADTITEQVGGLTRTYKKLGHAYRLTQISDPNGNSIRIGFDHQGNLSRIAGSAGTLEFEWSDGKDARLLAVADSAGRRISFKQEQQRLRVVTDAGGNEWIYDYSFGGLTSAVDPLGRVLLRVRYDRAGRVVESGDGAGAYAYEYDSASATVSKRTSVTDPLEIKTIYEHNERGALVAVHEDGGQKLLEINYDAANRATRLLSRRDGELSFSFDGQNRLTQSTSGDGSYRAYTYDERGRISSLTNNGVRTDYARDVRGNIVTATSSDPSQSYRAAYDACGRLLAIESATGRKTTNEYDAGGNVTAFSTEKTGRIRIERDATGRTRVERFPSGLSVQYERNASGIVTRKSDNQGGSITFERDSSGALTGFVRSDNTWIRATRDLSGRIVALSSSAGKSRRFAYDSRGGLTDYTDSLGRHKRFHYDARGRLSSISDDEGNKTSIERDDKGAVQRIAILGNDGWGYYYDRAGRLLGVDRLPGQFNKAEQFVSVGYNRSTALPWRRPANVQDDCLFGLDPSFDATEHGGVSCWDPFAGFGGGGDCDSFDSSDCTSFSVDTYDQCVARQRRMCESSRNSCGNVAFTNFAISMAACAFLTYANPPAGAVCAAAAYLHYITALTSCEFSYQNCLVGISDRCRR